MKFLRTSVRGRLACLVLATTLPAGLIVSLLVWQSYRNERRAVESHLMATARAVATVVDGTLAGSESLLKGLISSRELTTGDLAGFEERLRTLDLGRDRWIVLRDAEGGQLVNTRAARGAALPRQAFDAEELAALREGRSLISNVTVDPLTQQAAVFVTVPVRLGGRLRYTLSHVFLPGALTGTIQLSRFSPNTVISVADRTGTIAVRHPNGDRFTGRPMTPDMVAAVASAREGSNTSVTLEGVKVLAVHSRADQSGWTVAIGAPYAALYASARNLVLTGGLVAGLLLGVAVLMALWIGRALVRGVDALVQDTEVIGRGAVPALRGRGLAETDYVAAAMRRSAQRLEERERENASLTATLQTELEKQRRAEEASRHLAAIVESSEDAIVGKDLEGRVTSWNRGAERVFGYSAQEMIGSSILLLIPPDRIDEEAGIINRIRDGERVAHFETQRRRKDGTLVSVSLSVSPVRGRDGRVIGAAKIARDITSRKRAEAQQHALYDLVASVNRAEELPEICAAAIGAILRCQQADRAAILLADEAGVMRFTASHGLSEAYRRAVEGHSPWQPADPEPQPVWIDDVARATLEPALRQAVEREKIRALAFVPLTAQKRLLGKFMVYYDAPHAFTEAELRPVVTIASQVGFALERKRNADALERLIDERTASLRQAVAQMEEFSYSVSHDLRAPARAMCGYAEAILEDHAGQLDESAREMLGRIMRNSQRMDRLIQDLLTYTRISRREMPLERVVVERLVREVTEQYPELRAERADIEIPEALPDVMAHEPSLTQVISNLLSNAVKFVPTETRPRVVISATRRGAKVRVEFRDNGIGIRPEAQGRLFRMFERVHPDKHYEGTGIGLAIVRKALERMGGSVGVESDGVTGSCFWFELPAAATVPSDPPGEEPAFAVVTIKDSF